MKLKIRKSLQKFMINKAFFSLFFSLLVPFFFFLSLSFSLFIYVGCNRPCFIYYVCMKCRAAALIWSGPTL